MFGAFDNPAIGTSLSKLFLLLTKTNHPIFIERHYAACKDYERYIENFDHDSQDYTELKEIIEQGKIKKIK